LQGKVAALIRLRWTFVVLIVSNLLGKNTAIRFNLLKLFIIIIIFLIFLYALGSIDPEG